MNYRISLESYMGQTVDVKAQAIVCGELHFRRNLLPKYIESDLYLPCYKICHDFLKITIYRETGKATLLTNISINDSLVGSDTNHVWVPYDLTPYIHNGHIHLIGLIGMYTKSNGENNYGIEILGVPNKS